MERRDDRDDHPATAGSRGGRRAVADRKDVGRFFGDLIRRRRGPVIVLLVLHALAAVAGLVVPRILGRLVDQAAAGGTLAATLNGLALAVAGVVLAQALMTFLALRTSAVFGQEVLASAREYVVRTVLALPLGRVESASSGDLVTRVTRDVGTMAQTIRFGLPETVIAIITTALTVAAMLLNSPLLTLPLLVVAPLLIVAARRYLKRAPQGYITEGGTYSVINSTLTETVEGARTVEALERLIRMLDKLQVAIASTSRLLGIASVPPDREAGAALPVDNRLVGRDLRFAYRSGVDVLHGVDLALRPGERLAIVGPSGSGKSTLGRLLSGINGPRTGSVTVGGVELTALPLPVLRTEVALVTQEHHVFVGSVRDNIILAREDSPDEVVIEALRTVDAWDWVSRLPRKLDTVLGSGQYKLTPAQAQQIALARLVVADPHTLVLDEATSLIDPHTARHLEGSMAALLEDRTVVAIAHRLHTAHDADRIAVVIDGRIAELGSHAELLAAGGEYARLWRAWTS